MTPPRRRLGLQIAAALVIANMIGTGVFTTTGLQAARQHDPWRMPVHLVAGGARVYLREAYPPAVGFMSGWASLTAGFSAPIAVAALAFASYASKLVPAL